MSNYYPLFLNIEGQRCVVIGGGDVAERKVQTLLEYSALVTVISPEITAGIRKLAEAGSINLLQRPYRIGDLDGARLAIAATDDLKVNSQVAAEARVQSVLVNVVDDINLSEFIVPSVLKRGDVILAVSTGGKSPALARKLRTDLEKAIRPGYGELASMISEVRASLKQAGATVNAEAWQASLDIDALCDLLEAGKTEQARKRLMASLSAKNKAISDRGAGS